jgi:3-hydroxypropanoate dehydrogenase
MNDAATGVGDDAVVSAIFTDAHTHYAWADRPVPQALLARLYDVAKLGPTSANCSPMRVAFLCSRAAKERLVPAVSRSNAGRIVAASAVAVVAQDRNYLDRLPVLFPVGYDARSWFSNAPETPQSHGLRNTMLQAGYLIVAARALGLDCGPMSGFDGPAVDAEFFPDRAWTCQLLICLGYGESARPRGPRLTVDEACRFL